MAVGFLSLPAEVRNQVYGYITNKHIQQEWACTKNPVNLVNRSNDLYSSGFFHNAMLKSDSKIILAAKQIHDEFYPVLEHFLLLNARCLKVNILDFNFLPLIEWINSLSLREISRLQDNQACKIHFGLYFELCLSLDHTSIGEWLNFSGWSGVRPQAEDWSGSTIVPSGWKVDSMEESVKEWWHYLFALDWHRDQKSYSKYTADNSVRLTREAVDTRSAAYDLPNEPEDTVSPTHPELSGIWPLQWSEIESAMVMSYTTGYVEKDCSTSMSGRRFEIPPPELAWQIRMVQKCKRPIAQMLEYSGFKIPDALGLGDPSYDPDNVAINSEKAESCDDEMEDSDSEIEETDVDDDDMSSEEDFADDDSPKNMSHDRSEQLWYRPETGDVAKSRDPKSREHWIRFL